MFSKILSGAISGVEGYIINVETDISRGLPSFDIVGLPDSSVRESRERVRSAIKNTGLEFPIKKITVNLAPADIKKEGSLYDLPIAIGILISNNMIDEKFIKNTFVCGELSLNGEIRPVNGILPMVICARDNGIKKILIPSENVSEASLVDNIEIIGANSFSQVIDYLKGTPIYPIHNKAKISVKEETPEDIDFSDVRGQENVKRALMVSAAGAHNLLMIGPPGSGKSMLAKRFPTILPDLSLEESLEVTKIYSVSTLLENKNSLITKKPFRSPHHTASYSALVGGGRKISPGEVSLSHNGVLFLDELPEFSKNVLEVLRQPLEDGKVTISRASGTVTYPSSFILLASMNPCPCGYYGSGNKCNCTQSEISRYLNKISGPLLDRIDIQVESSFVEYDDLGGGTSSETSGDIKNRVIRAREIQLNRYKNLKITLNSELKPSMIDKFCVLGEEEKSLLKGAFNSMNLSARAYHKILKVARTIADLENSDNINVIHLAEAISYRNLDRKYW